MKRIKTFSSGIIALIAVTFLMLTGAVAQNNVGIGITNPDPSAILDLSAINKGLLIPRMDSAQRIAIVSPATGLLVYDTNYKVFYYWDGTHWVRAIGPMGPMGPAGAQGIPGIQGPSGAQGIQGPTGLQGPQGPQGIQGPTGATGNTGLQGAQGPTGANGVTGQQGIQGPSGDTGPQGIQGTTGAQGIQGITGPSGIQGATGPIGATGPVGCATANYIIKSNGTTATCTLAPVFESAAGNVGIGTVSPLVKLHITNGGILCTGTTGANPNLGQGERFMYNPDLGALRAGYIWDNRWDAGFVGMRSIGLGEQTWASGYASVALGYFSKAFGDYSFAVGYNSQASGQNAIALGTVNTCTGYSSDAFGSRCVVSSTSGIAIGDTCRVTGDYGISIGDSAFSYNLRAIAIGTKVTSSNLWSIGIGYRCTSSGIVSLATGFSTTASGGESFAANDHTVASGYASAAFGQQCITSGETSFAAGKWNNATGYETFASGFSTTAWGDNSAAFGYGTTSNAMACVTIGRYNVIWGSNNSWIGTDPLLVAGNGTSIGAPSNALWLLKDGDLHIAGTYYPVSDSTLKKNIKPINDVLGKIEKIHPVYFEFKNQETHPAGRQIGFIAQEIEPQFPELVSKSPDGLLGMAYGNMTAVLLQAIKELKAENDALKVRIEKLEKKH